MGKRRIKILHVVDSLGVGGTERMLVEVIKGLDGERFEHAICCITRLGEIASCLPEWVKCYDMGKGARRDLLMPVKMAQLVRRLRPDIVHTRNWAGIDGALACLLERGPRLVHSEHGRNLPYIHFEPARRKVIRRFVYHLADAVFSVSGELRDYYCRETGFAPERMQVIQNGVDVARFDAADGNGARRELGIEADDFVVGVVARLSATKDLLTLARAFARLYRAQREPHLKLLIVGDGEARAELEDFAIEQGLTCAIILVGVREDVPRLLRAMDVFALSSLSEGMPGAILEAMAASLPVVATKVGATPELVIEGKTGFLVAPRADEEMAKRLSLLLANRELARELGAAGRQLVQRNHSLEVMLQRYEELYLSLVSHESRRSSLA